MMGRCRMVLLLSTAVAQFLSTCLSKQVKNDQIYILAAYGLKNSAKELAKWIDRIVENTII